MEKDTTIEEKRLWIGNLDTRITEFQLLKLLQKHGKIEKFDLLFHKTGAFAGQPRGYAFVTYCKPLEAQQARNAMHSMTLGCKRLIVTWAHSMPTDIQEEQKKTDVNIPVLAISKTDGSHTDREFQIQAIEAKLKLMASQSGREQLEINKSVAQERSIMARYQQNQGKIPTGQSTSYSKPRRYDTRHKTRPYDKYKRK